MENVGLGPALVHSFEIHLDDSLYSAEIRAEASDPDLDNPWAPIVHALTGADRIRSIYSGLGDGAVPKAGERLEVFRIPPGRVATAFFDHRHAFHTTVCYCSLYGDCWLSDDKENRPRSVESCGTGGGAIEAESAEEPDRADGVGDSIPADSVGADR